MKGRKWHTEDSKLILVTFNVLMDVPDSQIHTYSVHDLIYTKQRWPALYKILGIATFLYSFSLSF